jgi:hypothetical protein
LIRRRNLLILGIALIAIANVLVYVLANHYINYSSSTHNGSVRTSGSFSLVIFAFLIGLVGFWVLMWGIFGRDFRGYPKPLEEQTQN